MSSATGILGRKIGMTQVFSDKGVRIPVTVIEAGPCRVLQVKTQKSDGYDAIQLGFSDAKEKNTPKPVVGHCDKAGSGPKRFIREIRLSAEAVDKLGDDVKVDIFNTIKFVDVTGISKGKGFQGVMKRHNFHGLPASHGCSKRHRAPGGFGRQNSINKGVPKGKKMAGHMGSERVTIQALAVVRVDTENNILLVKGAVPGPNGGYVMVHKAIVEKVLADSVAKAKAAK
jgi:large subunit ribosomal protein L3